MLPWVYAVNNDMYTNVIVVSTISSFTELKYLDPLKSYYFYLSALIFYGHPVYVCLRIFHEMGMSPIENDIEILRLTAVLG